MSICRISFLQSGLEDMQQFYMSDLDNNHFDIIFPCQIIHNTQMGNSIKQKYEYLGSKVKNTKKYLCCFKKPLFKLLILGLHAVGKTIILYHLKLNEVIPSIPSIGFNVEEVEFEMNRLQMWDVGGGCIIKQMWKHYVPQTHMILFIIDLSDEQRLDEAVSVLNKFLLSTDQCKDSEFFIIGNKKDLSRDGIYEVVTERLAKLNIQQKWHIRFISAYNHTDVAECFQEISEMLAEQYQRND